ncbi:C39 family peptidase [[Clostridium] colinum]|uniref:C39 family peptidase n=1 Tax=[Clostridium] colinum TaxID=36835 RepID=UPI0020244D50|nr:C39 family peptidase [[Clostridium] colinum]
MYKINKNLNKNLEDKIVYVTKTGKIAYEVYQNDKLIDIFDSYEEALEYAKKYENSSIKKSGDYKWVWDSNPSYEVYQGYNLLKKFVDYKQALDYAKKYENSTIFFRKSNSFIWESNTKVPNMYQIERVPYLNQYPELFRGCEVTSLAMLLNYKGIKVDKMELADKIKKEPFIFTLKDGNQYNGNPHKGFVGDIYSKENLGYGVYNEPIYEIFKEYVGGEALNLTGANFQDLYYYISKNRPVWIIINTRFKPLPEQEFDYLNTTRGNVKMTYREHSVLITGYDNQYIYYNDPMYPGMTQKQNKTDFIKAWEQMGKQAITYVP